MEIKETEKTRKGGPKSFLAVGPTLHYSHRNVQRCWLLAVIAFGITCLIWSRIVAGTFWAFDLQSQTAPDFWRLDQAILAGASIFEYPWQIIVLGLLMGVLAVVPILVAQLMSFGHCFLFILEVFFLANLPGFALSLVVSCFFVAARPLRFRSRIIAIALCTAPQLLYWGFFGSARGMEPLEWGFSFAPWIWAWLVGLTVAGLVLGIGHYTRYRPGLNWVFTTTTLLLALGVFEWKIGFDELDYQFYIAGNNPEEVVEFRDHGIREALDRTIMDPATRKTLAGFFLPTDPIPLREEVKTEIQIQLSLDRWPPWFLVPDHLKYQEKRQWLNEQYDRFIHPTKSWWMPVWLHSEIVERRAKSARMPIALYYKALLSEYSPDLPRIRRDEMLHFYSDYPHERSGEIWFELYRDFGWTPESAEARWRIAKHLAGRGRFSQAGTFLDQAQDLVAEQLARENATAGSATGGSDSLFSAFRPPAKTVMTQIKLRELQARIQELKMLIGDENLKGGDGAPDRLAKFVMLNPHGLEYAQQLDTLLSLSGEQDGLRDNLLLAKAKLLADDQARSERLSQLNREYQNTDGGMQALYELTRLKIRLYQQEDDSAAEKRKFLTEARDMLTSFLNLYPDSFYVEQVRRNLEDLPRLE
ncbi:MAG TPA: hypothetical protein PLU87_09220 [Sedimentisphaerales bacterium]|nr:hypothetical protein [Sedimentisphaerales bacterium]HRS11298.1 hypothetical protein [Sedimentisphaerales bacterium]HRV47870.1 hypothetical protein [Sedimentisphaerales bacterium]